MNLKCSEYADLAAAHIDGMLDAVEVQAADEHIALCPECTQIKHKQTAVKSIVRNRVGTRAVPDSVRDAIVKQIGAEAAAGEASKISPIRTERRRWLIVGAVAAGMVLTLLPSLRPAESPLIATLAADVAAAHSNPSLEVETTDPSALRGYYAQRGFTFTNTVEDLEPAGIQLVGGSASTIGRAATTMTVYTNGSERIVCRRFRVGDVKLPVGGKKIGSTEVFTRQGVNVALTRLGDIVCAMASTMPTDQFVASLHSAHHH